MPSTNSAAMPISMPSQGYFSRSVRQAVRPARKSASPAAPVVSKSMPSAPAATIASATKSMSSTSISQASSWARAGLVDLAHGQELRPVGDGAVGLRVAAQVGHGAVLHRVSEQVLGDLHGLAFMGDVGLDRLVGVVDLPELDHVDAEQGFVALQVLHAVSDVLGAGAVVAEHDLVADVDGGEARRRGVDVEQVVELVLNELRDLGLLGRELGAGLEIGLDLGARHLDERPVTHAGRDLGLHWHHLRGSSGSTARLYRTAEGVRHRTAPAPRLTLPA